MIAYLLIISLLLSAPSLAGETIIITGPHGTSFMDIDKRGNVSIMSQDGDWSYGSMPRTDKPTMPPDTPTRPYNSQPDHDDWDGDD